MTLWNAACYVTVLSGAFQRRENAITSRCGAKETVIGAPIDSY